MVRRLADRIPSRESTARNLGLILRMRKWPSSKLHVTCVDTFTAERCVIAEEHRVPINRAAAASSAVPGIFAPQQVQDRRCMDGGVSGTNVHLDLVAGARRAIVISLVDGTKQELHWGTSTPESIRREFAALEDSGTEVLRIVPEAAIPDNVMDPALAASAFAQGADQAQRQADEIRRVWS